MSRACVASAATPRPRRPPSPAMPSAAPRSPASLATLRSLPLFRSPRPLSVRLRVGSDSLPPSPSLDSARPRAGRADDHAGIEHAALLQRLRKTL
eukprot:5735096-Pleurochrysis_carterae.AAC.1